MMMKTKGMQWMFTGIGLVAGGALLAEMMDRGHAVLGSIVLVVLVAGAGYALRRAWREHAWLPLALMFSAPLLGVALWVAAALNEALRAA